MKRLLSLLFVAAFLLGTLSGCGQQEPIRIGLIAYLEGEAITVSFSGLTTLQGAQLAVDQANTKGGVRIGGLSYPIELVVEGIENNSEQAVAAARRLIEQEGVVAIVGPQYSGDAIAVGAIAEEAGIPMVSGTSTNPRTTENRRFVFRMIFTDTLQALALADLAYNDLRARRAAVFYNGEDAYSSGLALLFADSFSERGGEMVAKETFVTGDWEMEAQLNRIIEASPDLILLPVYPAEAIYQAGSLRKMGFTGTILGGDAWDAPLFSKLPAFDSSYSTVAYSVVVKSAANEAFINDYRAVYNVDPNDAAALSYDAVNMIFAAMQHEQLITPLAIRDGLYNLPIFSGVAGDIAFVDSGDPLRTILVLKYEDGEMKFFKAIQPRE